MAIQFEDLDTERAVIAACLKGAEYWQDLPAAWFYSDIGRKTYKELRSYLGDPYHTYPTVDLVFEKSQDVDVKLFVKEVSTIDVERNIVNTKVYDLFQMWGAREVYDAASKVPNDLEKGRIEEVVRAQICKLAAIVNPFEVGQRKRGFIYDSASARWERYRSIEKDPTLLGRIPYGISKLDEYTNGGTKRGHITLFFAKSVGFKSKVMANIAYNMSYLSGIDVMVITLEIPKDEYENIFDSRNAYIDYNRLAVSGLTDEEREKHRQSLITLVEDKPSLYIVDVPGDATTADVISENELYYAKYGKYPAVTVLDYINEIDPVTPWGGRNTGAKFKNVGKELRHFSRIYREAFISAMQENRKASEEKKHKEKVDLEHIGESGSFANVCHVVVHLYQDEDGFDASSNTLNWGFKKNRYGQNHVGFTTFINPAVNYVGDRQLIVVNE